MTRSLGTFALAALAVALPAQAQAPKKDAAADPPFKLMCESRTVRTLPRGNAAVGNLKFELEANPARQEVIVDGTDLRKATIDKFEVWFKGAGGHVISISRAKKTWGMVIPIEKVDDSRKYIFYEGDCKPL